MSTVAISFIGLAILSYTGVLNSVLETLGFGNLAGITLEIQRMLS